MELVVCTEVLKEKGADIEAKLEVEFSIKGTEQPIKVPFRVIPKTYIKLVIPLKGFVGLKLDDIYNLTVKHKSGSVIVQDTKLRCCVCILNMLRRYKLKNKSSSFRLTPDQTTYRLYNCE